jgi:hypothetical protein
MVRQESNNTQADLADIRGARFAMTSETEEGRQRLSQGAEAIRAQETRGRRASKTATATAVRIGEVGLME